jgi:hypothetical protein
MNPILRLVVLVVALALSGCAGNVTRVVKVVPVDPGASRIGQRLVVEIDGAWNKVQFPGGKAREVWTQEGVYLDALVIYSDVKDGDLMHAKSAASAKLKDVAFRADMQPQDLVSMFEALYSRDLSVVTVLKSEPWTFGGKPGVRFEFERIRKLDSVQLRGVGYAAIDDRQLYAMIYQAPRLAFFPRYKDRVEALARSARIGS